MRIAHTFTIIRNGSPDLLEFELHQWILIVAVSVVVREDPQAFGLLALRDEPPRALRSQEYKKELEGRRDSLDDGWDTP